MRRIDELFLSYPFYGARQMIRHLRREGVCIGRRRAGRLMRLMGLQAVYRAPRTSAAASRAPGLALSAQRVDDRADEPNLVRRHHLQCARFSEISWTMLPRREHVWNASEHVNGRDVADACCLLRDSTSRSGGDLSYIGGVT